MNVNGLAWFAGGVLMPVALVLALAWLEPAVPVQSNDALWWKMQARRNTVALPIQSPDSAVSSTLYLHPDGTWSLSDMSAVKDLAPHGRSSMFGDLENFAGYVLRAGKVAVSASPAGPRLGNEGPPR